MLDLDQRKIADAQITGTFLTHPTNVPLVDGIVLRVAQEIEANLTTANPPGLIDHFYLKGGNALSMLTNAAKTGDYDFQLVPSAAVYNNWAVQFPILDAAIVQILDRSLQSIGGAGLFNTTAFTVPTLDAWARANPSHKISFAGVVQGARRNSLGYIGRQYGSRTYTQIIGDPNFIDMRLNIPMADIVAEDLTYDYGPMIYVNYTIPNFILYRVVYSFVYTDAAGEQFRLKSEIIDISVPRKGSAEVHMSQEGVITHFRDTDMMFQIPGWGYHFYENINLLQEIQLGISGSKHKQEKRITRGTQALTALLTANPGGLLTDVILEPDGAGGTTQILGYMGALIYNVDDYIGYPGITQYNRLMIRDVRTKILTEERSRFTTAEEGAKLLLPIKKLAFFRLPKNLFDPSVKTGEAFKGGFADFVNSYNKTQIIPHAVGFPLEEDNTYCFISPFLEIADGDIFPTDYALIAVITPVFTRLLDWCRKFYSRRVLAFTPALPAVSVAFVFKVYCKGCVFYLLVQDCGANLPALPRSINLIGFLEKSILVSQRQALANVLTR